MFEVLFGTVWTVFTAFMTFAWFSSEGKFLLSDSLGLGYKIMFLGGPMFVLGIFWIIGLLILFIGLKKVIINSRTNQFGEECFGIVCDIYNSGTYINNTPELEADVLVYIPSLNETKVISEIIGVGRPDYEIGSYVRLKYYNNDINFEGISHEKELPSATKLVLENSEEFKKKIKNTITTNDSEYVQKDNIYEENEYYEDDNGPISYM